MNPDDNRPNLRLEDKIKGAVLGAAVGDALGWPQEMGYSAQKCFGPVSLEFRRWVRRAGGRFFPHSEVILPGEYSDDTQLILCTARSLAFGEKWWPVLTQTELPFWLQYERGGGGATKRAAESWSRRLPPWTASAAAKTRYFEAGGNGVAMRVLPHCVQHARTLDFHGLAHDIMLNGVSTHGHPRALMGALVYGFVLWKAIQREETLGFGELVALALQSVDVWGEMPDIAATCPGWRKSMTSTTPAEFAALWEKTIGEERGLLTQCEAAIRKGALSVDQETLQSMGCFDKRESGSGTIAAAAAIFLASRFAPDPRNGVAFAAFAHGADTDTIASMTGALLGAIRGAEWLSAYEKQLQDSSYLTKTTLAVLNNTTAPHGKARLLADGNATRDIRDLLGCNLHGQPLQLPDGRNACIVNHVEHEAISERTIACSWKLTTDDGQTLYIKKLARDQKKRRDGTESGGGERPAAILKVGIKIPVRELHKQRHFYEKVLGLEVQKASSEFVNLAGCIALIVEGNAPQVRIRSSNVSVYIEVNSISRLFDRVSAAGATIITPIATSSEQRMFSCQDPEGNVVEIAEKMKR